VLKMIAADLADGTGADLLSDDQSEAISMVTALRYSLCFSSLPCYCCRYS